MFVCIYIKTETFIYVTRVVFSFTGIILGILKMIDLKSQYPFSLVGCFLLAIFSLRLWLVAVFSNLSPKILFPASGSPSCQPLTLNFLLLFSCKAIHPQLLDFALGWGGWRERGFTFPIQKVSQDIF